MSVYMNQLFRRSNSSLFLNNGQALTSQVLRLKEDTFLVDSGVGTPKICTQDELTKVPPLHRTIRFENKVGFLNQVAGADAPIQKKLLERFFVDLVAGEPAAKERAAARFNDMVGSASSADVVLPRRFAQDRAWMELNKIWRMNRKVNGFFVEKVRGGYAVAVAGFIAFLPFRPGMQKRLADGEFTIESINSKKKKIVVR